MTLFLILGTRGPVLEVKCIGRSGVENFVTCMRKTLADAFPSESIGLGGIFCVREGRVKIHVMPEYSATPLKSDADVENWLKFYEMDAPYTCMSFLVSKDPVNSNRASNTDFGSLIGNTQCGNLRIFLPLIFYVKSILVILMLQKLHF